MSAIPSLTLRTLRSALGLVGTNPSVRGALRNPLIAGGVVAPAAGMIGGAVGKPIFDTLSEQFTGAETEFNRQMLEQGKSVYAESIAQKLMKEREKEEMKRNMMFLQSANPHLYNQVMAGRRLPQGSVVLGGQPREDLMEELASYMGSLPDPDPILQ